MRKIVVASATLAHDMDMDIALAYNMNQTKTRMSKEKIAERMSKLQDRIKHRQSRIKVLNLQKKNTKNPDVAKRCEERIAKHNAGIEKHKEGIKYYKKMGSLKPVDVKKKPVPTSKDRSRQSWQVAGPKRK